MTVLEAGSVAPNAQPSDPVADGREWQLGDAGGLTQFGAYLVEMGPGSISSDRHWHEAEDEFLYLLSGQPTYIDDGGETLLSRGDAICWRAGVPNGHCLQNRSGAPVLYLILGPRVFGDICHYVDDGRTQVNEATRWHITDAAGRVVKEGDLPPHLLDLAPRWGITDSPAPPPLVRKGTARTESATPVQAASMGIFTAELLSDTGGLTQFGVFAETLMPGARSSDRHWHEEEDELLYMLDGEATCIENDGPHVLGPGDACAWPRGVPNAHHIVNRSDRPCTYLVAGTRWPTDTIHYADIDELYRRVADGTITRTRRDGSPLEGP